MGQEINNSGKKLPQYIAALAAAGGGLIAGLTLGWSSPTEIRLVKNQEYGFEITTENFSWIGASMTLGAAIVCIPSGYIMNQLGRRLTMLSLVIPLLIGWSCIIFAKSVTTMYIGRFLLGIAAGTFCVVSPIYIGEIADASIRGTLGTFFHLMITGGILVVYIIGSYASVVITSSICAIIPIIFGIIIYFMPESPVYLVSKKKTKEAIESIKWLSGDNYNAKEKLQELEIANHRDTDNRDQNTTLFQALMRKSSLKALFIAGGLMFFQQLSGINAVIFYTTGIFKMAKTGIDDSIATILVGTMQVIATLVSTMVIDRLGRCVLLLLSSSIMAACSILLGVYFYLLENNPDKVESIGWLPVASLCLFIIMFSIGFGPIPWLMLGELFSTNIKDFAGSLSGTLNWTLAFIVTKTFSNFINGIGTGPTFWLFSSITVVASFFVFFFVPETKGKSLSEIQNLLENNTRIKSNDPEDSKL